MSKFVKQLIIDDLKRKLVNVQYAMLVSFVGLDANKNHALRSLLAEKGIEMTVIKNSLARRATEGTELNPLFHGLEGSLALCWGAQDIVSLAKDLVKISKDKNFKGLEIQAAVMDGEKLDAAGAIGVSKWPSREEQISIILGQIVGVGAKLSSQFIAVGGSLASQFKQLGEKDGEGDTAA